MAYAFLIHDEADHVGVAVRDLPAGEPATGVTQRTRREVTVTPREPIPLGHKVALVRRQPGEEVVKYHAVIGVATAPIEVGDHVHIHNIRSARW